MTESKENSSKWGNYGEQYQQIMMKIPFVFSVKAASLLFPTLLSKTIEHERIHLVDIASGPGVFESALFDSMYRSSLHFAPDSAIVVTDFAPGMIEAAKKALHANDLHSIGMDSVKFDVVDACDPHNVENHSFTHMACMFGIMFFPKRAQALQRLREKLIPGVGRALFGSWNYANPAQLCHEFGLFLDPNAEIHRPSQESSPLNVCKDPDVFKEELIVAGFHDIDIVQEEHTFDLENDESLFSTFISNPALASMYPELSLDKNPLDVLRHRWQEFLHSEEGQRNWLTIHPDGKETVQVRYIANLAIALA